MKKRLPSQLQESTRTNVPRGTLFTEITGRRQTLQRVAVQISLDTTGSVPPPSPLEMLRFETERVSGEWSSENLDKTLRTLVNGFTNAIYQSASDDCFVSCIFRTFDEDAALYHSLTHEPGVHCYWRGADISIHNLPAGLPQLVCDSLNETWVYDPARPEMLCFLFEGSGVANSTAPHVHIQAHPNTTKTGRLVVEGNAGLA